MILIQADILASYPSPGQQPGQGLPSPAEGRTVNQGLVQETGSQQAAGLDRLFMVSWITLPVEWPSRWPRRRSRNKETCGRSSTATVPRGGVCGIGVVSEELGINISQRLDLRGSNNVAECEAMLAALQAVKEKGLRVSRSHR